MLKYIIYAIPFIQIGLSYYISVSCAMAIILLVYFSRHTLAGLRGDFYSLFIIACMFFSQFSMPSSDPTYDFLRLLREAAVFYLLTITIRGMRFSTPIRYQEALVTPILVVCSSLAVFVIVQNMFYSKGVYFGLPEQVYAQDSGTLPGDLDLYYGQMRPNGTFAEPSYLAFILSSFLVMIYPIILNNYKTVVILFSCLVAGSISRSLAFWLATITIIFVPSFKKMNQKHLLWTGAIIGAIVVSGLFTDASLIFSRFDNSAGVNGDESIFARVTGPITAMPGYLFDYPFGVSITNFSAALQPFVPSTSDGAGGYGHNGIFNLFFLYGVVGAAMLARLIFSSPSWIIRLYILAAGTFNGAFLGIDKLAVILLTVAVFEAMRRSRPTTGSNLNT